jgi:hypothetical protein
MFVANPNGKNINSEICKNGVLQVIPITYPPSFCIRSSIVSSLACLPSSPYVLIRDIQFDVDVSPLFLFKSVVRYGCNIPIHLFHLWSKSFSFRFFSIKPNLLLFQPLVLWLILLLLNAITFFIVHLTVVEHLFCLMWKMASSYLMH